MNLMEKEIRETPNLVAKQLKNNAETIKDIIKKIKAKTPEFIYIIGRGSSNHIGTFSKYLIETETQIPVVSATPSTRSIYNKKLRLKNSLVLIISQSGKSPDILLQAKMAKDSGALTISLVNNINSPLAKLTDLILPLNAGEEKAIAATKSFLTGLTAILNLVSIWSNNQSLYNELFNLPEKLNLIINNEIQLNLSDLENQANLIVLGRGFGFAIALEIALKLKEILGIQAEAFSSAEFLHGPVRIIKNNFLVLNINVNDESFKAHNDIIENVKNRGAIIKELNNSNIKIHSRLLPLLILQRFYLDIEKIAKELGFNPDNPPGLNKATETI